MTNQEIDQLRKQVMEEQDRAREQRGKEWDSMTPEQQKAWMYKCFTILEKSYYKSFGEHLFRKEDK